MKGKRKITGGRYKKARKRKLYEKRSQSRVVKLGQRKSKFMHVRGGARKIVLLSENKTNLMYKGKSKIATIKNVIETPCNRFLARQNVLVKGAIIETDMGKARITNRPSQEGMVQSILIEQ